MRSRWRCCPGHAPHGLFCTSERRTRADRWSDRTGAATLSATRLGLIYLARFAHRGAKPRGSSAGRREAKGRDGVAVLPFRQQSRQPMSQRSRIGSARCCADRCAGSDRCNPTEPRPLSAGCASQAVPRCWRSCAESGLIQILPASTRTPYRKRVQPWSAAHASSSLLKEPLDDASCHFVPGYFPLGVGFEALQRLRQQCQRDLHRARRRALQALLELRLLRLRHGRRSYRSSSLHRKQVDPSWFLCDRCTASAFPNMKGPGQRRAIFIAYCSFGCTNSQPLLAAGNGPVWLLAVEAPHGPAWPLTIRG
jgi:hypothetical protein